MPLYPFEMQIAVDANSPYVVVQEGLVTICEASDPTNSPIPLQSPSGMPMNNPITTSRQGFIPAFQTTSPHVKWSDGTYAGFLSSHKGMLDEAIAAREAAQTAAVAHIPAGGTTGQVLTKASDTSGHTRWGDNHRIDISAGRSIYVWDSMNNREQLAAGDTGHRALYTWNSSGVVSGGGGQGASGNYLGVYWPAWNTGGAMTNVDTDYNLIYAFAAVRAAGTANLSWEYPLPISGMQAARARGQKVILSVGGSGQGINFSSRAISQQLVTTFQTLATSMGGVDGIDFNTFEADADPNLPEYQWMAGEFKRIYGPNFIVTSPPAPWSTRDQTFCQAMLASGSFDFVSPQYYDGPGMADQTYIVNNYRHWVTNVAGGDARKVAIGFGISPTLPYYFTTATAAVNTFQAVKAEHPTIRGAFLWQRAADADAGWAFANAMGPLVGTAVTSSMPPGLAPVTGVAGGIYLRRLNNTVQLAIQGARANDTGQSLPIPDGFRPGGTPHPVIIMPCTVGTTLTMASHAVGVDTLWMSFPNTATIPNAGADYGSVATWTTQQRWPTSLPGTATGAIPY